MDAELPRSLLVRQLTLGLVCVFAACWSDASLARKIAVDFQGGASEVSPDSGDAWVFDSENCGETFSGAASCGVNFSDSTGLVQSRRFEIGFDLKIGDVVQPYTALFIDKRGLVTFGSALPGTGFEEVADFAALQSKVSEGGTVIRPFIAPFYADLVMPSRADDEFTLGDGGSNYYRATADSLAPYSFAEAVPAFAVTWIDIANFVSTQIVIYRYDDGDPGDFDLRIRYGVQEDDPNQDEGVLPTNAAGLSFGAAIATDSFVFQRPLSPNDQVDYFYCVRDGHVAVCDRDEDGVLDLDDNCPTVANAGQADSDGDGIGDACETSTDGDGDGVENGDDNCPAVPNPDQLDGDTDGVGDSCDNCPATANTNQADADNDGVGDSCDNCPATANANQADADNDGVGDSCDNCAAASNANQADGDGDTVGNVCDNCPSIANTNQADSDGNGVGDACQAPPAPQRCDADADRDIDARDLEAILRALGRNATGPTDPRDFDGNGKIRLNDLLNCTKRCTRKFCAVR